MSVARRFCAMASQLEGALQSMAIREATMVLSLPADVTQVVFSHLGARDLASCLCCCKAWRRAGVQPALWHPLCEQRWRHGVAQQWEGLQHAGRWHELFLARTKLEADARELLRQLQWPQRWLPVTKALLSLGLPNFKDMLIERARSPGSIGCGVKYWARTVSEDLTVRQAAQDMAALVASHEDKYLDEGALLVACIHHPLVDLSWVRSALDALGAELSLRLQQAGVQGGLPALEILNSLLFGPMPPPKRGFAIPPPDGFGLGLQGNREAYYEPANSLLNEVLVNREGIPISLAVIHAAVAARAGLEVQLLNVPTHVVTHFGAEGSEEERFIDVFDGGRVLTREEMGALLQELGLPGGFDRHNLQPMEPARVYARICYNLASIYSALSAGGDTEALKMQQGVMRMVLALDSGPPDFTIRMELVKACARLDQLEEAMEMIEGIIADGVAPPGVHAESVRGLLQSQLDKLQASVEERDREMGRRKERGGGNSAVRYKVGQIMRHRRYNYRGVIIGWDPECVASEDWMKQMGVDKLGRGRHQPFYNVLPDSEDRAGQQSYVAEENIRLEALPPRQRNPGFEAHPEVGRYFEALRADGTAYELNEWMRERYPEDC